MFEHGRTPRQTGTAAAKRASTRTAGTRRGAARRPTASAAPASAAQTANDREEAGLGGRPLGGFALDGGGHASGTGQDRRCALGSLGRAGHDLDDPEAQHGVGDPQHVRERLQQ